MRLRILILAVSIAVLLAPAMPPPPDVVNPLWPDYCTRKSRLGIDRAARPVRDHGKQGLTNGGREYCGVLVSGTKNIPAVLIFYSDYAYTYDTLDFQYMLFGTWTSGSAHDYFSDVSYDSLNVTGKADGWYIADYAKNYYGYGNGFVRAAQLAREAAVHADVYLNYSQFDNDHDGYVDLFTVVHAGYGAEETGSSTDIWSHQWYFSSAGLGEYVTSDPDPYHPGQNIKVDLYTIQPERSNYSNHGTMVGIGVYCHEWAHGFGLPDLYDTDPNDGNAGAGLGNWCLMAGGSWGGNGNSPWCPSHMCAWAKRDLGWIAPLTVSADSVHQIAQIATTGTCYLLPNAVDSREYFLIENRQQTGFDATLHGSGLCIYHIDEDVISARRPNNEVNAGGSFPNGVALEQADGFDHLWYGSNTGDAGDVFPGTTNNTAFDSSGTDPDSRTNGGQITRCGANQISSSSPTMQAYFYRGPSTLAIPIVQNPFLDEYMDIWVAPTLELASPPAVTVVSPADSTSVTMAPVESTLCYRGDYQLTGSGQITVHVSADGLDTSRVFTALYCDEAVANVLRSPDRQAKIELPQRSLARSGWITIVEEAGAGDRSQNSTAYTIGPGTLPLDNKALLAVQYDPDNASCPRKLGIYERSQGGWLYRGGILDETACRVSSIIGSAGTFCLAYDPAAPDLAQINDLGLSVLPNPARGPACVAFTMPRSGRCSLILYDAAGRLVSTVAGPEDRPAGAHLIFWNTDARGAAISSGVYFLVLRTDSRQQCVKVVINKRSDQ